MTTEEYAEFLEKSGNAFAREATRRGGRFSFRERGCKFVAMAYDDDPQLLHITACWQLAKAGLSVASLGEILGAIETEFAVVKLRTFDADNDKGDTVIEVSAEQYEGTAAYAESVFWRTVDLIRTVGIECVKRLKARAEAVSGKSDKSEFDLRNIEKALENGSESLVDAVRSVSSLIRESLALVISSDGQSGSAFCVASLPEESLFITNAHVVKGMSDIYVYRQVPCYEKLVGSIVATGTADDVDLAVVAVRNANIPSLVLCSAANREQRVAVAGYARVQLWAAETLGEIVPAIHVGTVTAVNKTASIIMHDALSRPGNSGGPLYDPETGEVLGVQQGGWDSEGEGIAIGSRVLASFLAKNDLDRLGGDLSTTPFSALADSNKSDDLP
jgi:S1-C subfamily serine protease